MNFVRSSIALLSLSLLAAPAFADPIVAPGGKPGAATSWKSAKSGVVLTVGDTFDADDVAAAINKSVKGAKAVADGTTIIVTGVAEATLVKALEKIDVEPALDDVDEMLSSLKGGDGDEGSGSSIRATKAADFSDVIGPANQQVLGHVTGVTRAKFPLVILTVKVTGVPRGVKGIKKGDKITVVPRVKSRDGVVDPNDRASQLNVGAWYSQTGDKVKMNLAKKRKKNVWIAKGFERKTK